MDEEVKGKVNGPGVFLIVVGLLSVLANLGNGILQAISLFGQTVAMDFSPEGMMVVLASGGWQLIQAVLGFLVAFIVIYGGVSLRNTRSAGAVYAGSILAMIPCCIGCCCIIGIPAGVWALIVMQDEQVKKAFEETYY